MTLGISCGQRRAFRESSAVALVYGRLNPPDYGILDIAKN